MLHAATFVAVYLEQADGAFIPNPAVEAAARRLAESHDLSLPNAGLSLSQAIDVIDQFADVTE